MGIVSDAPSLYVTHALCWWGALWWGRWLHVFRAEPYSQNFVLSVSLFTVKSVGLSLDVYPRATVLQYTNTHRDHQRKRERDFQLNELPRGTEGATQRKNKRIKWQGHARQGKAEPLLGFLP